MGRITTFHGAGFHEVEGEIGPPPTAAEIYRMGSDLPPVPPRPTGVSGRTSISVSMPPLHKGEKKEPAPLRRPSLHDPSTRCGAAWATPEAIQQAVRAKTRTRSRFSAALPNGRRASVRDMLQQVVGGRQEENVEDMKLRELADIIQQFRDIDDPDIDTGIQGSDAFADSMLFDVVSCLAIMLNAVAIALETDMVDPTAVHVPDRPVEWIVVEALFCLLFIVEASLKAATHSWRFFFEDYMNFMSLLVVAMVTIDVVLDISEALGAQSSANGLFRLFSMLRIFKLAGLRSRLHWSWLRELKMLIQGFMDSLKLLAWVSLGLFVFLYIASVFTTTQIGRNPEFNLYRKVSGGWDNEHHFGTIGRSMMSLLKVLTLDGWLKDLGRHVLTVEPLFAVFFVGFTMLSTFGLLNLLVAYLVIETLHTTRRNDDKQKTRLERDQRSELEGIRRIFELADQDGSDSLSQMEFISALKDPQVMWRFANLELALDKCAELFASIDGDEPTRELSLQEFIDGCMKLKGPASSKDFLQVQAQADILGQRMDELQEALAQTEADMAALDEITMRMELRFGHCVGAVKAKIAGRKAGAEPVVHGLKRKGRSLNMSGDVPPRVGNRPVLPPLPDRFLRGSGHCL